MYFDLPNLLLILLIILVSFRLGLIPFWLSIFLGLFAFTPLFLNNFIFQASYMPDQFKYLNIVQNLRSFSLDYGPQSSTVEFSSWLFAFIPLPFVETINSLGFYNRFIATILIIWLYTSKNLRGWPLLFLVFYPSFILYSSLALRDTFITIFMVVSMVLFIDKRRFFAVLVASPLFIIKFQNFFLIIIFFVVYLSFIKGSFFYKVRYLLVPTILAFLSIISSYIIETLNFYRRAMFSEDGGDFSEYVPITSMLDFLQMAIQSGLYFLIKPFFWQAEGVFQFIQSIENIGVIAFLSYLFLRGLRIDTILTIKWFIFLVIAMSIYGVVVFNFGTAARYRFPFIIFIVIGFAYDLYKIQGYQFLISKKYEK